jgi:hypothetical protein
MGSNRIKGKALRLTLDGENVWADITKVELDNEEGSADVVTFQDASQPGGGRQYFLNMSAVQSTDTASFWAMVWAQSGEDVPFVFAPHGNEVATASQPHFTGICTVGPRPKVGGEAGRDNTYTFDTRFDVVGIPVLDDGA